MERSRPAAGPPRRGWSCLCSCLGFVALLVTAAPVGAQTPPATADAAQTRPAPDKVAELVELEQMVSCDAKEAGKLLSAMGGRGFPDLGLRYIQRYRELCGRQVRPEVAELLANREALLRFHAEDDEGCLHALAGLAAGTKANTAWNRALCGGPCALDAGKCAAVAEARKAALAARALHAKRRAVTEALCQQCEPTEPCSAEQPSPLGDTTLALAWNLKTARKIVDGRASDMLSVSFAGDLNGDGLGDVVIMSRHRVQRSEYLYGRAFRDGSRGERAIPALTFRVLLGCGARHAWKTVWHEETARAPYAPAVGVGEPGDRLDEFELRVEEKASSDIPSVCIYKSGPTCAFCSNAPLRCLDLGPWRKIAAEP